ncbi:MAG: class II SORL domain-containing protein [Deferribacterota bacterium]|nr:class II SORL domain-containing protein [Deferribacterota bacterium]
MSTIGNFIKSEDYKKEKHVPVIELPDSIKAGEEFQVKVSVGKEIKHPNLTEHFIAWIELFFNSKDGKNVTHLGKAEFLSHGESTEGPNKGYAYTEPVALFNIKLDKPGTLVAVSYCNIHGLWENTVEVNI